MAKIERMGGGGIRTREGSHDMVRLANMTRMHAPNIAGRGPCEEAVVITPWKMHHIRENTRRMHYSK